MEYGILWGMSNNNSVKSPPLTGEPPSKLIPVQNRRTILAFCAAAFLWWFGLYLYLPVLPVYVQSLGGNLTMVGIVVASYAIPQVLFRIPIGIWADRLSRRKIIIVLGMIFALVGAFGLGMSNSPWQAFAGRFTAGIGAAVWVVYPIYLSVFYPLKDGGRAIVLLNFVQGASLILAMVVGGFIAEGYGYSYTFFNAAALGVLALMVLAFTREQPVTPAKSFTWKGFSSVASHPLLIMVSVMGILSHFAAFAVLGFVPVYATEIGASEGLLGIIMMVNSGFSALSALVAVRLWDKLGHRNSIILGAVVSGASLLSIPFIPQPLALMAVQVGIGLGNGIVMNTCMALTIHGVQRENRATSMGVFSAVYAIGMLLGPLVSGYIGRGLGLNAVFFTAAAISVVIAGLPFIPRYSKHINF
jgi:DHA1 family multidrug resistance protein-like MFS transporter